MTGETQNPSMYRATLLDHFHNPRNKGDMNDRYTRARGNNPRCGDEVEVGLTLNDENTVHARFEGRGCIACLSSASIMVDAISALPYDAAQALNNDTLRWLNGESDDTPTIGDIAALAPVIAQPARKQCVQLAWKAATAALDKLRDS